jgi:hypothetical protein
MRVLVTGDRNWTNKPLVFFMLNIYNDMLGIESLKEGCARGADRIAEEWAEDHGITPDHYPADWDRYGKAAGPIRNRHMLIEKPDYVFAFHENIKESKGTKDMVNLAVSAGIPTWLHDGKRARLLKEPV